MIEEFGSYDCHEFAVDYNGCRYLIVIGKHVNGGFCSIINWNVCCELSQDYDDILWNEESLSKIIKDDEVVGVIARSIASYAKKHNLL